MRKQNFAGNTLRIAVCEICMRDVIACMRNLMGILSGDVLSHLRIAPLQAW